MVEGILSWVTHIDCYMKKTIIKQKPVTRKIQKDKDNNLLMCVIISFLSKY